MIERRCVQCGEPVTFDGQPADGECPSCGQRQYLTEPRPPRWPDGAVGRYPMAGGIRVG